MRIKFSKIGAVLLALMLMSTFALGETAMVMPKQYFFDGDGDPLAGGKIYTYEPSTQIPKDTFTTEAGTTPNQNPVILNSEGYSAIYIEGSYAIKVTDSDDVTIWTADPVTSYITGVALSDSTVGSGSDLVAHTGTADTVTEALAKKVDVAGDTITGIIHHNNGTATAPRVYWDDDVNDTFIFMDMLDGIFRFVTAFEGGATTAKLHFETETGTLQVANGGALATVLTTEDFVNGAGALVVKTLTVGLTSGVAVPFHSESYDDDNFHGSPNDRLTIPAGYTRARIVSQVAYDYNASGVQRSIQVYKNGALMTSPVEVTDDNTTLPSARQTIVSVRTPMMDVAEADYFEIVVIHDVGGPTNVDSGGACWMSIEAE